MMRRNMSEDNIKLFPRCVVCEENIQGDEILHGPYHNLGDDWLLKKQLQAELGYESPYISMGGRHPVFVPETKKNHVNHLPNGRCIHHDCGKIDKLFNGCDLGELF